MVPARIEESQWNLHCIAPTTVEASCVVNPEVGLLPCLHVRLYFPSLKASTERRFGHGFKGRLRRFFSLCSRGNSPHTLRWTHLLKGHPPMEDWSRVNWRQQPCDAELLLYLSHRRLGVMLVNENDIHGGCSTHGFTQYFWDSGSLTRNIDIKKSLISVENGIIHFLLVPAKVHGGPGEWSEADMNIVMGKAAPCTVKQRHQAIQPSLDTKEEGEISSSSADENVLSNSSSNYEKFTQKEATNSLTRGDNSRQSSKRCETSTGASSSLQEFALQRAQNNIQATTDSSASNRKKPEKKQIK